MPSQGQLEHNNYDVEVSGWDREQDFFVEKTILEWYENRAKTIFVRHPVSNGAVVFVRILDATSSDATFPIAYQVESVTAPDMRGLRRATLQQLQPRAVRSSLRRTFSAETLAQPTQ